MKNIFLTAIVALFAMLPAWTQNNQPDIPMKNYTGEWIKADSLLTAGQPQSAGKIVDKIYAAAQQEKNVPQFIKAVIYRLRVTDSYEEEALAKNILDTEELLRTATFPAKNILHTIAADLYWQYYRQNRRQFSHCTSRTPAPDAEENLPPDDLRTLDLPQLVARCVTHYSASLEMPEALQQIHIGAYAPILKKALDSERYRPTLFDFLAFRAAAFYQREEAGLTQPADRSIINRPAYFAPAAAFAQQPLATADTLSFPYQSLVLLQKIIAFHLPDTMPDALVDADLWRLDFVHVQSVLPDKDSLYLSALQALETQYAGAPCSAEIAYRMAKLYSRQGDAYHPFTNPAPQWKKKEAVVVIDRAASRFPESFGANNCLALKNELLRPSLTLSTDEATAPGQPLLVNVAYRNVPKVYIKIVALDFKKELTRTKEDRLAAYEAAKAVHTAALDLPDDGDYQQHAVELALPALSEGYYALLASADGRFSGKAALVTKTRLWVTNISFVKRENNGEVVVQLLDRTSGQPLGGVTAQCYTHKYDYSKRRNEVENGETYTSDAAGRITLTATKNQRRSQALLFTKGKDSYAGGNVYLYRYADTNAPQYQTTFFTDRAIYRPGQTVYFKGVVLKWKNEKAAIAAGYKQTVTFYNVNGEKVSELPVATNEFGSFAGSFAVPANGLTGQMRMEASAAAGTVYFQVEEYKRPAFEVTFDGAANDAAYRLGEKITLQGQAKTYAGSAVSDAKVTYRVMREARYPLWRWWWGDPPFSPKQQIANGETVTNADGSFDISFTAIPDARADKTLSPVFHYAVYAAVSDMNGETHEAKTTVPIGYRALLLSTSLAETVNLEALKEITVTATNLQGKALPVKGTLTVWKLRSPERILQPRRGQRPDKFVLSRAEFEKLFPYSVYDDEDRFEQWERTQVFTAAFDTETATTYTLPDVRKWTEGKYMVTLAAADPYGERVENTTVFTGFRMNEEPPGDAVFLETLNPVAQPGETLKIVTGSAYDKVEAWLEITGHNGAALEQRLLRFSGSKQTIAFPVTEAHRGGFGVSLFFVRHNRAYSQNKTVQVPFNNKKLSLELATFRDKLQPGQEEEWRITVKDHAGDAVAAELLASMYDASLDAFAPNKWNFFPWKNNMITFRWNTAEAFQYNHSEKATQNYPKKSAKQRAYDRLIPTSEDILNKVIVTGYASQAKASISGGIRIRGNSAATAEEMSVSSLALAEEEPNEVEAAETAPVIPLRTNFHETAFFYPQLTTNENGETVVHFTVPESLTRWNLQALAWTGDLKTGYVQKEPVTQKELMIFTNAPRFFRENDTLYFSAKLSSLAGKPLDVTAQVCFFDAFTMQEIALLTAGEAAIKTVSLAAGGNRALSWKIHIPEGLQAVTYRITTGAPVEEGRQVSDGEENTLPVLTNRMLVTESLPLPMRGAQPKQFEFTKLLNAGSATLRHHAYTIEFTSHPVWYAVQALPYLMEYPYECAEQVFSRYYANAVAAHIAQSDPKIKHVFDRWRNYQPAALQSNLAKNEELKSLLLEETPWVRDARNDAERKQRIALLFDLHRMRNEQAAAGRKMQQAQSPDGGFAWFRGSRSDRYITQHIVAGTGRMQKMNIPTGDINAILAKAIRYMDDRLAEDFNEMKKQTANTPQDKKENPPAYLTVHYLYARSFFTDTHPLPEKAREAFAYFTTQAAAHWTKYNNYSKGMLALALHRYNDTKTAQLILQSLSETALHSDETGMYWRYERGWWWYQAPVETQALLIEAFDEIARDPAAVADMQIWLLKQKQTQDWKTTKATADAIYALLKSPASSHSPLKAGEPARKSRLAADGVYQITAGDSLLTPAPAAEAGTGYFKTSWHGSEINPDMGRITITPAAGTAQHLPAWGAAYWQYFEQLDKITSAATGIQINKRLYRKTHSPAGDVLTEITPESPVTVGDKITVRIEIRADRDMEYVHLKDQRAAAFEPVNVLSGYRRQDGLGYYESTRDAATNFFIAYLPKRTCVFEYDLFATQAGEFSNGVTSLQCMYAPEFTAHSEGKRVAVAVGSRQ